MKTTPSDSQLPPLRTPPTEALATELCIVGGGIAGVCAAIAAARDGIKVTLIQDRPVLGGNASSEVRMWICGALGRFYKESGILEEIQLLNHYRNPGLKYTIWDTVIYEKIRAEKNITLILNCAVCEVRAEANRIQSVKAWHLTRQCWITVSAPLFMDCSGDSVLRYSGALHRWGREDKTAFDEAQGQAIADRKTMGNSLLLQLREIDPADHHPFTPPAFALKYDDSHHRAGGMKPTGHNFWWIEIGGEDDTLNDADKIRDELYAISYGVWDFIKNHPDGRGHRWELEWIGALPGKRENVRYVGGYTLKQQDIESQGKFDDVVAHGGWTMDDHPPAAFNHPGKDTTHYAAPSPYGIPYGVLYSANIENLLFAGRNLSATHMAMSSTRVMGTCSLLGQAAGTAAAMALKKGISPAAVAQHITELQNRLMDADQWLPSRTRALPAATQTAQLSGEKIHGNLDTLRNGLERRLPDGDNWVQVADGGHLELKWSQPVALERLRLVVHSDLHDTKRVPCNYPMKRNRADMPTEMPKTLRIEIRQDGIWREHGRLENNHRRLIIHPLHETADGLRVTFAQSWGGERSGIFAIEVGAPDYHAQPNHVAWPEPHWTGDRRLGA